jgi:hypothetical protein
MTKDEISKQKRRPQQKTDLKRTLQGILERMREGMEELTGGLQPVRQPIPIPAVNRRRRR